MFGMVTSFLLFRSEFVTLVSLILGLKSISNPLVTIAIKSRGIFGYDCFQIEIAHHDR